MSTVLVVVILLAVSGISIVYIMLDQQLNRMAILSRELIAIKYHLQNCIYLYQEVLRSVLFVGWLVCLFVCMFVNVFVR